MRTRRDWQGLERKIFEGRSLEDASLEAGIPLEEAETYLRGSIRREEVEDKGLLKRARDAERTALSRLTKIANEGPRSKESDDTVDFQAARVLLDFSLKARKLARETSRDQGGGPGGERDLFDKVNQASIKGPWDLRDPGT